MATIAIAETTDTAGEFADERRLVERAKKDPAALATLYRTYYPTIYGYILRRVGSQHEVDDLVAEVFLAMVRYLPRFRWSGAPFRAWLYRLATNQVNRWARRQRRVAQRQLSQVSIDETADTNCKDAGEWGLELEQAQLALLTLPPRYQAVLSLHYLEEMPLAEVAIVLGCRLGTVKSRLSRGRDALRKLLVQSEDNHA